MKDDALLLGGRTFTNRLFTGTGKFGANAQIPGMLAASGSNDGPPTVSITTRAPAPSVISITFATRSSSSVATT